MNPTATRVRRRVRGSARGGGNTIEDTGKLQITGATLGARLRSLRLQHGISQDVLAGPHFTKSYISALERDKVRPSLKALTFLAERLGVTASSLLAAAEGAIDDTGLRLGQAEAHLLSGQPDLALPLLQQQLAEGREMERLMLLGRALASSRDWPQADAVARQILQEKPAAAVAAQAHDILGTALAGQGHWYEAMIEHRAATGDGAPEGLGSGGLAGELQAPAIRRLLTDYQALHSFEDVERLTATLDQNLNGFLARRMQQFAGESMAAFAAGETSVALTKLSQARALESVRQELLLALRARLLRPTPAEGAADNNSDEELQQSLTLATLAGSAELTVELLVRLAKSALAANDLELAEQHANQLLQIGVAAAGAATAPAQVILGRIATARGHLPQADKALIAALEAAEAQNDAEMIADVARTYAEMLVQRGEHEEATRYFRRALAHGGR